jgi:hypothetical protein
MIPVSVREPYFTSAPMTPTILVVAVAVLIVIAAAVFTLRRLTRYSHGRPADLGMVSTRWITELRRDEPWSRS